MLDSDDTVSLDSYVVSDGSGSSGGGGSVTNGVALYLNQSLVAILLMILKLNSVEITGEYHSLTPLQFLHIQIQDQVILLKYVLYAIGADQPIVVNDVTLTVDGVTYGGSGADSLVFDNILEVWILMNNTFTYTFLSTSQSWGGFRIKSAQAS